MVILHLESCLMVTRYTCHLPECKNPLAGQTQGLCYTCHSKKCNHYFYFSGYHFCARNQNFVSMVIYCTYQNFVLIVILHLSESCLMMTRYTYQNSVLMVIYYTYQNFVLMMILHLSESCLMVTRYTYCNKKRTQHPLYTAHYSASYRVHSTIIQHDTIIVTSQ